MNIGKMETEYSSSSSDDESTLLKKYVSAHLPCTDIIKPQHHNSPNNPDFVIRFLIEPFVNGNPRRITHSSLLTCNVVIIFMSLNFRAEPQDAKMWDIFENPPAKKTTGSADLTRGMEVFLKFAKVCAYLIVLVVVLAGCVVSKLSFIFMTSQLTERTVAYCNDTGI